jgi:SAM-dependent methyltransferase
VINNKDEYVKMNKVERRHWWYVSLHALTLNAIKKNFNLLNISILDAGCGTGGLLSFLKNNNYYLLQGFDIADDAVKIAKSKNMDVKNGDLKCYKFDRVSYDVIISNDTMYFFDLKEKKHILNEFHKSLNTNGLVILNLPSFNIFSGIHDQAVGIQKRFDRKMINEMINKSKYKIEEEIYWPFLLTPIIFFVRFLQRIQLKINKSMKIESDIGLPPAFINNLLIKFVKLENKIFSSKPFGSSLFLVIKKIN